METETESEATKGRRERVTNTVPLPVKDWTVSVTIGILTVSHWRGLWTLFDIWTCDQPSDASLAAGDNFCFAVPATQDEKFRDKRFDNGLLTYALGVGLTLLGIVLMWGGLWYPDNKRVSFGRAVTRFFILYILGAAANCTWRGIWYLTDHWILPDDALASYLLTSFAGAAGAFALCAGGSLLAPPALFLLDGPSIDPPPLAVTIVETYYCLVLPHDSNEPPKLPKIVLLGDFFVSFFGLPIMVVWFWRGTWLLLDKAFWDFTDSDQDVGLSILWSALFAVACYVATCEPIMSYLEASMSIGNELIGRLRTFIMAWGTVAFWRAVWTFWDLYLGGTSEASAWISHAGSIAALTLIGCLSCIAAPPATLGVDAVPHPESADEPLFSMLPLPYELLYLFAIGRQPAQVAPVPPPEREDEIELSKVDLSEEPQISSEREESERQASVSPVTTNSPRRIARLAVDLNTGINELRVGEKYCEMQRPHLSEREKSATCLAQRPGFENRRKRSKYFRNR